MVDHSGAGNDVVPRATVQETDIYRLLVESVLDEAVFVLDPTGAVLTWNAGAERIKGWTASEIIGRDFSMFFTDEDRAAGVPERELAAAAQLGRAKFEGWRARKDGTWFWASVVITALRDPSGELVGFAKMTRDLTDRRRAELALRESEQRFRLIVTSVKDYGIFMLDPGGHIASWNEGAERLEGYTAAEIIGKHFSIFYPAEDLAAGKPAMELRVAAAEGRYEDEGWRIRKDGSRFWANVVITALRNDAGELVGFGKVTRDLTERRESELRKIEDARRMADIEASNRTKAEFLTAMSHELRTPLNAIGGYTELLSIGVRGPITEAQRADLERIRRSQQHLLGIINDLLNFSRIEAGQITYESAPVRLEDVVNGVLPMIEPQAAQKELALTHECGPRETVAFADRAKVEQIVINLLSNAVKFTPSGGRIAVTCFTRDGDACIAVADTGVGIPEDKLESVFEPFVQLGRTLTTSHEGTGLGLAISRDLARAMRGDLRVESAVGKGSTFTLSLPKG